MAVIFRIEMLRQERTRFVHLKEHAIREKEKGLLEGQRCYCIANTLSDHQAPGVSGDEGKKEKRNTELI